MRFLKTDTDDNYLGKAIGFSQELNYLTCKEKAPLICLENSVFVYIRTKPRVINHQSLNELNEGFYLLCVFENPAHFVLCVYVWVCVNAIQ